MKIGLVCPYDFFRHGAVQKLIQVLDAELTSRGHDVRIITPRPQGYDGEPPSRTLFVGRSTKWNTPLNTTLEVGANFIPSDLEEMLEAEKLTSLMYTNLKYQCLAHRSQHVQVVQS